MVAGMVEARRGSVLERGLETLSRLVEGFEPGGLPALLRKLDLFADQRLDRASPERGDKDGHGAPPPGRMAKPTRTHKVSVSMSDPTAGPGVKPGRKGGAAPYHLAPWLAMAAMAGKVASRR